MLNISIVTFSQKIHLATLRSLKNSTPLSALHRGVFMWALGLQFVKARGRIWVTCLVFISHVEGNGLYA